MNSKGVKDNFFKIDPEAHLIGDMTHINHFPGVQMWWKAIESIKRPLIFGAPPKMLEPLLVGVEEWEMLKNSDPANLLRAMDKYGVDIACLLPEREKVGSLAKIDQDVVTSALNYANAVGALATTRRGAIPATRRGSCRPPSAPAGPRCGR